MAQQSMFNAVGAIIGLNHGFGSRFLQDGRSLHPLQRVGNVDHTGWPSIPVQWLPRPGGGPPVGVGTYDHIIAYPKTYDPSITTAVTAATRVS